MRRPIPALVAIALLISACAPVAATPVETASTTTSELSQTTTTDSPGTVPVTAPAPSTISTTNNNTGTTALPTTTTSAGSTQVAPTPEEMDVAPWFFIDETGHASRTGAFLLPVQRKVAYTKAVARASLEQLFAGPTRDERNSVPAISTTIPNGVRVLGLTIKEGIAIVDLSSEFGGTDTSPVISQRMAQVVFTLTSIPHITEVVFRQNGKPVAAQTSDGSLLNRPVLKADYLDFAAALTIEQPVYGGGSSNPLHVSGFGAVFEAAFNWVLTDNDGLIIAEGYELTTNGTGWGAFDFTIGYKIDKQQVGSLVLWTNSAENGQRIDIREYPVTLVP